MLPATKCESALSNKLVVALTLSCCDVMLSLLWCWPVCFLLLFECMVDLLWEADPVAQAWVLGDLFWWKFTIVSFIAKLYLDAEFSTLADVWMYRVHSCEAGFSKPRSCHLRCTPQAFPTALFSQTMCVPLLLSTTHIEQFYFYFGQAWFCGPRDAQQIVECQVLALAVSPDRSLVAVCLEPQSLAPTKGMTCHTSCHRFRGFACCIVSFAICCSSRSALATKQ